MLFFKACLRRPKGEHHSDYRDGIYCNGVDEAAARANAELQHPGFKCQKLVASHVAIVAATKTLASQWIGEIIAGCKSDINSGPEHFGSINLHALGSDEDLTGTSFDEIHIVITESVTCAQIDQFRLRSRRLYMHVMPNHKHLFLQQSRAFKWASESDFTTFLSSIFSVQENGLWIAGSWEGFTQTTINSGSFRVIHSHEPLLSGSLSCLLDQLEKPTSSKSNCILLIVRGDKNLTIGDLVIAHDAVEAHFPNECEVAVTFDRTVTTDGYKLLLLLDSIAYNSSKESSGGR